jgi:hypothetical protein
VNESEVEIKTSDGTEDAYFVHPSKGAHAGVLIRPDIYRHFGAWRRKNTTLHAGPNTNHKMTEPNAIRNQR